MFYFGSYSVALSPCDGYVLVHDSSSCVELHKLDTWELTSRWDLVLPRQWKWRKQPIVFGLSCAYVAGMEGQLSCVKIGERLVSCAKFPNGSEWLNVCYHSLVLMVSYIVLKVELSH